MCMFLVCPPRRHRIQLPLARALCGMPCIVTSTAASLCMALICLSLPVQVQLRYMHSSFRSWLIPPVYAHHHCPCRLSDFSLLPYCPHMPISKASHAVYDANTSPGWPYSPRRTRALRGSTSEGWRSIVGHLRRRPPQQSTRPDL